MEKIKALILLEAVLVIEIMSEPQSNLEQKVNPCNLKYYFSSRTDPYIFTSIESLSMNWSNETSRVFPAMKSTSHFLPQSPLYVDQIQNQKPIHVVATDQMPDHT